jgi:hypothetical protein
VRILAHGSMRVPSISIGLWCRALSRATGVGATIFFNTLYLLAYSGDVTYVTSPLYAACWPLLDYCCPV